MPTSSIAIIGGGPGGLLLARLLQTRGVQAAVFERDAHADERPQGGSLDLHAETGQRAMVLAGLEQAFLAESRPEHQGDRLYDANGTLLWDEDGAGHDRPEIDRAALRRILLASLAPGTMRWGSKVQEIVPGAEKHCVVVDGRAEHYDVVVGADGAWSRVRPLLSSATPAYQGAAAVELGFDAAFHPDVAALVGEGKMFAAGDNRTLIGQLNGHGHVRGYAAWRMSEDDAHGLAAATPDVVRARALDAFGEFAPALSRLVSVGDVLGVRAIHALPVGHRWQTRPGLTLLGDAAHLMSPFSGEGVNLALADSADLADALTSDDGWPAVAACEAAMAERAADAAAGARDGMDVAISSEGVAGILQHYRQRDAS